MNIQMCAVYFSGEAYYVRIRPSFMQDIEESYGSGLAMRTAHTLTLVETGQQEANEKQMLAAQDQARRTDKLLLEILNVIVEYPDYFWTHKLKKPDSNEIYIALRVPPEFLKTVDNLSDIIFATPCYSETEADEFSARIQNFFDQMLKDFKEIK